MAGNQVNVSLPGLCFISHAYADAEVRNRLLVHLPSNVKPFIFPQITVPPHEFVSNRLVTALLNCDGLIYLDGAASERSFWVAFERDYALRASKQVFAADPQTLSISPHLKPPLDLATFASYHRDDAEHVLEIASFLKHERH